MRGGALFVNGIFSRIVGNDALKKRLSKDLQYGSLSHAYIIEGKKGCGKHLASEIIAAAVNCTGDKHLGPCGTCEACRRVLGHLTPDVITVSRESGKATLGVDPIRALCTDASTVPGELDRKVYVIEEAELLTHQAQNALLLTLEEPPPFVMFLLLCDNALSLLETIRSRAPIIRVEPLDRDTLDTYLSETDPRARLLKNNQRAEYEIVLTAADGSVGEALRLLDSKERKQLLAQRDTVEAIISACAERSSGKALATVLTSPPPKRADMIPLFSLLLTAIRDLLLVSRAEHPHLCFYTNLESATERASSFSLSSLVSLFESTEKTIDALSKNASVPLTLVNFSVSVGC